MYSQKQELIKIYELITELNEFMKVVVLAVRLLWVCVIAAAPNRHLSAAGLGRDQTRYDKSAHDKSVVCALNPNPTC
jgi:hypothetical protein